MHLLECCAEIIDIKIIWPYTILEENTSVLSLLTSENRRSLAGCVLEFLKKQWRTLYSETDCSARKRLSIIS